MEWNEQKLEELTELAKLQFKIEDIEILLEMPENTLHQELQKKAGKVYLAFKKGVLTAQMMLKSMNYMLAENGSANGLASVKADMLGVKDEYNLYE